MVINWVAVSDSLCLRKHELNRDLCTTTRGPPRSRLYQRAESRPPPLHEPFECIHSQSFRNNRVFSTTIHLILATTHTFVTLETVDDGIHQRNTENFHVSITYPLAGPQSRSRPCPGHPASAPCRINACASPCSDSDSNSCHLPRNRRLTEAPPRSRE